MKITLQTAMPIKLKIKFAIERIWNSPSLCDLTHSKFVIKRDKKHENVMKIAINSTIQHLNCVCMWAELKYKFIYV